MSASTKLLELVNMEVDFDKIFLLAGLFICLMPILMLTMRNLDRFSLKFNLWLLNWEIMMEKSSRDEKVEVHKKKGIKKGQLEGKGSDRNKKRTASAVRRAGDAISREVNDAKIR